MYAKARSHEVRAWSYTNQSKSHLNNSAGRCVGDATWRNLIKSQLTNQHTLEIMLDMKKAFDYVNREKLMQAAKDMGYPMHALAMSTISYHWNRSICIEQRLSKPIRPRRGIAAGSAFATFELAVLLNAVSYTHLTLPTKRIV